MAGERLTVIIPVYNEEKTVGEIIRQVKAEVHQKQIIVVNDGSTDNTRAVIEDLADARINYFYFYHQLSLVLNPLLRLTCCH